MINLIKIRNLKGSQTSYLGYRGCFKEPVGHQGHSVWGRWPGAPVGASGPALPGDLQHPHIADTGAAAPSNRLWGELLNIC